MRCTRLAGTGGGGGGGGGYGVVINVSTTCKWVWYRPSSVDLSGWVLVLLAIILYQESIIIRREY